MEPGPLLLRYFHHPLARATWLRRQGFRGAVHALGGNAAMRRAARRLQPIPAPPGAEAFEASFMTGAQFWHQTAFCAHSLARQLAGPLRPTFYDDGTLQSAQAAVLQRLFPLGRIWGAAEIGRRLEQTLPHSQFPRLHDIRAHTPMFRKLIDVRAGASGWQLYLDSDMLFFARPSFLLEAARAGRACYMQDRVFGYCLPADLMEELAGGPIRPQVNAGILGLDSGRIDWPWIESWLQRIPRSVRLHRLLEQTVTAILLSRQEAVAAPEGDYVILTDPYAPPPEGAALLHYIQHAKWTYTAREWRRYLLAHGG